MYLFSKCCHQSMPTRVNRWWCLSAWQRRTAVWLFVLMCVAQAHADLFDTVNLVCHECGSSVYCTNGQQFPCPANSLASTGSNVISDCVCNAGYLRNSSDVCNLGQPPFYYQSNNAFTCPQRQQTIASGAEDKTECVCVPGSAGSGQGVVANCALCQHDHYQPNFNQSACLQCPSDASHELSGQTDITSCVCDPGHTGPNGGTCQDCAAGKYKDVVGSTPCTNCSANFFSGAGASQCTQCREFSTSPEGSNEELDCLCNPGYHLQSGTPLQCIECQPGHYHDESNNDDACKSCAAAPYDNDRFYQDQAQSTTCKECTDTNAVSQATYTGCKCSAGYKQDATGLTDPTCTPCRAGKYQHNTESITCIRCPDNAFSDEASPMLANCYCNAGYYEDDSLLHTCAPCPANTFKPSGSVTLDDLTPPISGCQPCPHNSSSTQHSTAQTDCTCDAGFSGPDGGPCTACALGEYKDTSGTALCQPCAQNSYADALATITCTDCPSNSVALGGSDDLADCVCDHTTGYNVTSPNTACALCRAGTYATSAGCVQCSAGEFAEQGSTSCTLCAANTVSKPDFSGCECAPGFACIDPENSEELLTIPPGSTCVCAACPPNTFKSNPGEELQANGCDLCPANTNSPAASVERVACKCNGGFETVNGSFGLPCTACAPGHYAIELNQTCVACGAHRFTDQADYPWDLAADCSVCPICPPDQYDSARPPHGCGEDVTSACINCPPNTASVDPTNTTYRIHNTSCACVADMYGPLAGPCSQCPTHEVRPQGSAAGATTVSDCVCAPGFSRVNGTCTQCNIGSYKVDPGDEACTPCPTSTTTQHRGNTERAGCVCAPGDFMTDSSALTCQPCPGDTFQDQFATPTECRQCREFGTSVPGNTTAARQCLCDSGHEEQFLSNEHVCVPCNEGFDKSAHGNGQCTPCPVNTFTNTRATTTCAPCPASSSTLNQTGQRVCSCDAGLFGLLLGNDACQACPQSPHQTFRSDLTTQQCTDCAQCLANEQVDTECVPTADITCKPCQNNSNSQPGRTTLGICNCNEGFQLSGNTCVECAIGTARAVRNDNSIPCATCPSGKVALTTGLAVCPDCDDSCPTGQFVATECTPTSQIVCQACGTCPAGDYMRVLCASQPAPAYEPNTTLGRGDVQCALCPAGFYCPVGSFNPPTLCPDSTQSLPGSTNESDCGCEPGYYRPNATSSCVLCPFDFYCPGDETPALPCPNHSTTFSQGEAVRTACHCHRGYYRSPAGDELAFQCALCTPNDYCFDNDRFNCTDEHMVASVGSGFFANCTCIDGFYNNGTRCEDCPQDHFCRDGNTFGCPPREWTAGQTRQSTCVCRPGFQRANDGLVDPATITGGITQCQVCLANHYCPGFTQVYQCTSHSLSVSGSDDELDCKCDHGFQPAPPTANTSHSCEPCPTNSTDRTSNKYKNFVDNTQCLPCTVCDIRQDQYTADVCRPGHNAVCSPCDTCAADEFISTRCQQNGHHRTNRVCSDCSTCNYALEYQLTPCQTYDDTECRPISRGKKCLPGEYPGGHTTTTDAQCLGCIVAGNLHVFFQDSNGHGVSTYNDPRSCQIRCVGFSKFVNASEMWRGCETCEVGNALLKLFNDADYNAGTRTDCVFQCKTGYERQGEDCVPRQVQTGITTTPALHVEVTGFDRDATGTQFTLSHSSHSRFVIAIGNRPATNCKASSGSSTFCCFAHMTRVSSKQQMGLMPVTQTVNCNTDVLSHTVVNANTLQFSLPDPTLRELANCTVVHGGYGTWQCNLWLSIVDTIAWRAMSQMVEIRTTRATTVAFINSPTLLIPLSTARAQVHKLTHNKFLLVLELQPAVRESGAPPVDSVTLRAPSFTFVPSTQKPECAGLTVDADELNSLTFNLPPDRVTTVSAIFEGSADMLKTYLALHAGTEIMDVAVLRNVSGLPIACTQAADPVYFDLGIAYAAAGLGTYAVGTMTQVAASASVPAPFSTHGPAGTLVTLVARASVDYVTSVEFAHATVVHLRDAAVAQYASDWDGTSDEKTPVVRRNGVDDLTYEFRRWCRDQTDAGGSACQYHYLHHDPQNMALHTVDCSQKGIARRWIENNYGAVSDGGHVFATCAFVTDTAGGNTHASAAVLMNTRAFMDKHDAWTKWQDWTAQPYETKVWSTFKYVV